MANEEKPYWLGLNLVKGIGAIRLKRLISFFGEARAAWHASPSMLASSGLSQQLIKNLIQVRSNVDLKKIIEDLAEKDIQVLTQLDVEYPKRLLEIDAPPPVLYVRGEFKPDDEWAVAIVGTRRITPYGRQVALEIASFLSSHGLTVVSGLARGVDTIAHTEALHAGGRSIAVLGNGIDRMVPPENRKLAERLLSQGALVSDYPPGTPPEGANFPPRNRIISGLSLAVVVIEAGERSGALITASFAADQGREVFAVPGGIYAPQSRGTNRLIHQGARPLLNPEEILEILDRSMVVEHRQIRAVLPENELEASLLDGLSKEPLHVDELTRLVDMSVQEVSAALAMMELKGMVRKVGSMRYVVVREGQAIYKVS
jgi:DNA processing protein